MGFIDTFKSITTQYQDNDTYDMDDIIIRNTWIEFDGNNMKYLLFDFDREVEPGYYDHVYKAIKLVKLKRVPKKDLAMGSFLQMQEGVITGYYQNQVNYIQLFANIIRPTRLGLIFAYGVQGVSSKSIEDAKYDADLQMEAVERTITGTFRTLEYIDLSAQDAEWIFEKLGNMSDMRVIRGIPVARKTQGRANASSYFESPEEDAEEQSEEFLMGMDEYEYLFVLTASTVDQNVLSRFREQNQKEMTYLKSIESGQKSLSAGISMPMVYGSNIGASQGWGTSQNESWGENLSHSVGESHSISDGISHSVGTGTSHSISDSVSHGTSNGSSFGTNVGQSAGTSFGENIGSNTSFSSGLSSSFGNNNSISHSVGMNDGMNIGANDGTSTNVSDGTNHSVSNGTSHSVSDGTSHSVSNGTSSSVGGGSSWSSSSSSGSSYSASNGTSQGEGNTSGMNFGLSFGSNDSVGSTQGESSSWTSGFSSSSGGNSSWSNGTSHSVTDGTSHSVTNGTSSSVSDGTSHSVGSGTSTGLSSGYSVGNSISNGNSAGISSSQGASYSSGGGNSYGQSFSGNTGTSMGASRSTSNTVSDSTSHGITNGTSTSESDGTTHSVSNGTTISDSTGTSTSRGTGTSTSGGVSSGISSSMGIGPSLSFSKSYAWNDVEVTHLIDMLSLATNRIIQGCNGTGMWFTDIYVATDGPKAAQAATSLAMTTWHGKNMLVSPLQVYQPSPREKDYLMKHMSVFSPSTKREGIPGRFESYKYTTLLLPEEIAAYSHPPRANIGGILAAVDDPPILSIPGDRQNGEIFLGYVADVEKYSKHRDLGYKSDFKYALRSDELHHAYISGASRSGKTVAARRLVAEAYTHVRRGEKQKKLRFLIMDPKQDWRALAKVVPYDHFRFYSLSDPTYHPIRLNLMKIPRGVFTERYADKLREIFIRSYGLGDRGFQLLGRAIRKVYKDAGCFDEHVKYNKPDPITGLCPASERSKNVTMHDVCNALDEEKKLSKARDQQEAIQRVIDRMENFAETESSIYTVFCNRGEEGMGIDDLLGADDVVVLESYGMDTKTSNFIFGLITSAVYQYAVSNGGFVNPDDQYETVLVIEEANQVLISEDADNLGGANPFEIILDQSAGYGLFIWTLTQKIADMPRSVLANSAIKMIGRQDDEDDIKKSIVQIGKDGLIADRVFKNWLPDQPTGWFIIKSSRNRDFSKNAPCHVLIEYLDIVPPDNDELSAILEMGEIERQHQALQAAENSDSMESTYDYEQSDKHSRSEQQMSYNYFG